MCRHHSNSQRQDAATLTTDFFARFEAECVPRIAAAIG
ncbi:hypothetical protein D8I24_1843 [Cupriavidus necator H850]|nr:hypothetical protein D8I24_1843 [Cupriavidus necator H850]